MSFRTRPLLTALLFWLSLGAAFGQANYVYFNVHSFSESLTDGVEPYSNIAFDSVGNAYCTTLVGGMNGAGAILEVSSTGTTSILHSFGGTVTNADGSSGPDGSEPYSGVTFDTQGNLYGTAPEGGANSGGVIWEITIDGAYLDLHDFGGTVNYGGGVTGPDGIFPIGAVSFDGQGNMFGTTLNGGLNSFGMVWEIKAVGGQFKDIHNFGGTVTYADGTTGNDGKSPYAGVSLDSHGNMFGSAYSGGENSKGVVWEITSGGVYKDLHDFGGSVTLASGSSGTDGKNPMAGVTVDSAGDLFGLTYEGGASQVGVLWEITSAGAYEDRHDFGGTVVNADGSSGLDGQYPYLESITMDKAGDLFGTASSGGALNLYGMVWELTATGAYKDLHDFGGTVTNLDGTSGPDGRSPFAGVTVNSSGDLYGTCSIGGPNSIGTIWEIVDEPNVTSVSLNPSTIVGGYSSTATLTLTSAVASNTTVTLANQWPGYVSVPTSVTVPAGSSSVTFTASVSQLYAATFTNLISATLGASSKSATLTVTGEKLSGMTVSPTSISGFGTSTGTVTITNPAPTGGWDVSLKSALPGYVSVPSSVTVAAGATTATFTLSALGAHVSTETCSIYATDKASGVSASITLKGDSIASLSLNPTTIGWSGTTTGTVMLNAAAPAGGWVVNLSAGASGYLSMSSTVTVPEGATSATFSVTGTTQRSSNLTIRVNAGDGATSSFANLNLVGDHLSGISLSPSSVAPGKGSTGTITLSAPAPVGGWKVNLTVGAPSLVGVPASVTVPAGATSVTFPLTTAIGASATSVVVIANDGTSREQTTLTIT